MSNKLLTVGALIAQLTELDPAHKITAWYDGERRFFHHDIDASLTEDGIVELNCDYEGEKQDTAHCLKCDGIYPHMWAGKPLLICPHCGNDEMKMTVVQMPKAPQVDEDAAKEAERHGAWVSYAQCRYNSETISVDDDAKVSEGDDKGAWVQGWLWVDYEEGMDIPNYPINGSDDNG